MSITYLILWFIGIAGVIVLGNYLERDYYETIGKDVVTEDTNFSGPGMYELMEIGGWEGSNTSLPRHYHDGMDFISTQPNRPSYEVLAAVPCGARCQLCDFARQACPQIYYCEIHSTNKIYNEVCKAFRGSVPKPIKIRDVGDNR